MPSIDLVNPGTSGSAPLTWSAESGDLQSGMFVSLKQDLPDNLEVFLAILVELRLISYALFNGLNVTDDLDSMRVEFSQAPANVSALP